MAPALTQLTTLAVLAGASLGTGQLLARALGLRRLERLDATSAAASALLGFTAWTVGFSLLSGAAGFPAPRALMALLLAHPVMVALAWRRRGARLAPSLRGPAMDWVILGSAIVLTTVLALLPVLRYQAFRVTNDTYAYCALATELQLHGFGEPVTSGVAALYQQAGFPLGAAYPLALAGATELAPITLALYPAVSAWGLALMVCGVWWMARRALRVGSLVASATVLVFALTPHAAYWAHHNGFLSQTLAVGGLLMGLAALATRRGLSGRLELVTFAMAAAFLCSVYVPLLGLLGAAALVRAMGDLRDARRQKRLGPALTSWAAALVLPLVLVGFDIKALANAMYMLGRATTVGGHISLGPLGFAAVALGPGPGSIAARPHWIEPEAAALTLAAAAAAAVGVRALWKDRRGHGVLAALAVLGGLLVKYALLTDDHWTGERGHTWFVFKIVQWAWPLFLLTYAAGLASLRHRRGSIIAVVLVAAASLAPAHLPWSRTLGRGMDGIIDEDRPLARLPDLLQHFRALPEGRLVLLGLPERVSNFRGQYAALFAWPRPIVIDWKGSAELPVLKEIGSEDVVPVLAEAPPFDRDGRLDLGAGFARLTGVDRPRLVQIVARLPAVGDADRGGLVLPLARSRTKLLVLAPRGGPVEVELRIEPPAGASTSVVRCQVIPGAAGGLTYRRAVHRTPVRPLRVVRGMVNVVRFDAEPGLNAIVLVPDGAPHRLADVLVRAPPSPTRDEPSS